MEYFRIFNSFLGGYIDLHWLYSKHELNNNANASRILADHGYHIQLLPYLPESETAAREKWLVDVYGTKNPDVRINEKWIGEIKTPDRNIAIKKSSISRAIYEASRQKAQIAILNLNDREYLPHDVKKGIIGALQPDRNKSIEFVWIITNQGNLFIVDRKHVFDEATYQTLEHPLNSAGDQF